MIEPTQEFIKKAVENHFDVSEVDTGLVKMKFYFEDQEFKFLRICLNISCNTDTNTATRPNCKFGLLTYP